MNEKLVSRITSEVSIALAKETQRQVRKMSFAQREKIIANIRAMAIESAETFAQMAVEETGMGNVRDKIAKNRLAAEKTPGTEDISTTAWSGDLGLTLTEMAPYGIIGAITPSTNPSETVICNTIGMLAGGNTVVFSPHPNAMRVSQAAINLVNRASEAAGGPAKIAFTAANDVLLAHKDIELIVATGSPKLVDVALRSGKRAIGAGGGNPPVLVDETADIKKAAKDIIDGCTFDNNLPCIAEKALIAVSPIADELMRSMIHDQGCYPATREDLAKLEKLVFTEKGTLNRACVGKDANTILNMLGIRPGKGVRCITFEAPREHPMVAHELMMPILGMVREPDFEAAVGTALWLEDWNRHSAMIHSRQIERVIRYEKAMDTTILVKNAPSYTALGFGSEGFCTFTIASRTGEGLTSASTFTRKRRKISQ